MFCSLSKTISIRGGSICRPFFIKAGFGIFEYNILLKMTTTKKRKQVSDFVSTKADERFINMVYAMMLEYDAKTNPFTEEEFSDRFHASKADVKAGRVVSHSDVKKKFSVK